MRKFISLLAAVLVAGALAAGSATAEPSDRCDGAPAATGTDGDFSISVCVEGVGALTAAQKGNGGYIVADGDSANADIHHCLDGFIGLQADADNTDNTGPVASGDGEYSYPYSSDEDIDPTTCAPA